jgi:hypothetical protein
MVSCFGACGEAEHHNRELMVGKAAYFMVAGKQRENGAGVPIHPAGALSQGPSFFQLDSTS